MVRVRIGDVVSGGRVRDRAVVVQQKTKRPVQFEIMDTARKTMRAWLERRGGTLNDFVFPSRNDYMDHMSTRQYARLVREWVVGIGLPAQDYGTHSLRRTKASIIYKATGTAARVVRVETVKAIPEGLALIVESVPERLDLKRDVLSSASARSPQLLASNTSAMSIDVLAESVRDPSTFLGLHFFNPVWSIKLLEIVQGAATSSDALAQARTFGKAIGKETITVRDVPGFATSRLDFAASMEAIRMLEDGVASADDSPAERQTARSYCTILASVHAGRPYIAQAMWRSLGSSRFSTNRAGGPAIPSGSISSTQAAFTEISGAVGG